jgi:hypothetical protein
MIIKKVFLLAPNPETFWGTLYKTKNWKKIDFPNRLKERLFSVSVQCAPAANFFSHVRFPFFMSFCRAVAHCKFIAFGLELCGLQTMGRQFLGFGIGNCNFGVHHKSVKHVNFEK